MVITSQYPQLVAAHSWRHNIGYMEMKDRIARRMRELGIKQQQLADMVGMSQVGIQKILAGGKTRRLAAIARALETTAEQLEFGDVGTVRESSPKYAVRPSTMAIARFDVAGSMGIGRSAPEGYTDVVERIEVNREYLRRTVQFSAPENLAIITALGDSMAPTFNDCDLLLVDRGVAEIRIDAIYVIRHEGEIFIKRMQRRPGEMLLMISDNKAYEPQPISKNATDFEVLGRVLMAWNARKL